MQLLQAKHALRITADRCATHAADFRGLRTTTALLRIITAEYCIITITLFLWTTACSQLMTIDYYESPSTALQLLHQLLRLLLRYTAADYCALLLSAADYTLLLWTTACYQLHINDH